MHITRCTLSYKRQHSSLQREIDSNVPVCLHSMEDDGDHEWRSPFNVTNNSRKNNSLLLCDSQMNIQQRHDNSSTVEETAAATVTTATSYSPAPTERDSPYEERPTHIHPIVGDVEVDLRADDCRDSDLHRRHGNHRQRPSRSNKHSHTRRMCASHVPTDTNMNTNTRTAGETVLHAQFRRTSTTNKQPFASVITAITPSRARERNTINAVKNKPKGRTSSSGLCIDQEAMFSKEERKRKKKRRRS